MIKVKKIITEGLEVVKDSARQLAKTVSPGELAKQALGQQKNEFSDYLKNLSPDLSKEELEKKKKELSDEEKKKLEEARDTIKAAIPDHMRPIPKPPELRSFEKAKQEEEQKKAAQVEAMKKQSPPVITPAGKQQRGSLFAKKKGAAKGFEGLQKDTKVG